MKLEWTNLEPGERYFDEHASGPQVMAAVGPYRVVLIRQWPAKGDIPDHWEMTAYDESALPDVPPGSRPEGGTALPAEIRPEHMERGLMLAFARFEAPGEAMAAAEVWFKSLRTATSRRRFVARSSSDSLTRALQRGRLQGDVGDHRVPATRSLGAAAGLHELAPVEPSGQNIITLGDGNQGRSDGSSIWRIVHLNEEPKSAVARSLQGHRADSPHFRRTRLKREDRMELMSLFGAYRTGIRLIRCLNGWPGRLAPRFSLLTEGFDCRIEDINHLQVALEHIAQETQSGVGDWIMCHGLWTRPSK